MSEILLFTIVAIGLYFFADWILRTLERRHGKPFENRSIIYFVIILALALASFELIPRLLQGA